MATKKTDPPREYANAMDKLRDEMVKPDSGRYVQVVGEFLTNYLLEHPEAEAAILAKDKSIAGSLKVVRDEASKQKQGNVAVLDDETAFRIVLKYYGIKGNPSTADAVPLPLKGEASPSTADAVPLPLKGEASPTTADAVPLPLKGEAREQGTTEAKVSGGTVLSDTPTSTGGGQDAFATGREFPGVSGEPSPSDTGAGSPAKEEIDPFDLDALLGVI